MKKTIAFMVAFASTFYCLGQKLVPGFNISEYRECISMASHWQTQAVDSIYFTTPPTAFERRYSSPIMGFDNLWELWEGRDSVLAVSIRGSVMTEKSWMSNFHAAMVPASGTVHLGHDMAYSLSDDSLAHVHVGWLVSMLVLAEDIEHKLDSAYACGYRDVILTGHSQGGAICFLLTQNLIRRQAQGYMPKDITFKTYCSAAPKPGDYNFAIDYESTVTMGMAFNVVNADDWVPEVPLSVQQITDFRPTNPFNRLPELTKEMKAIDRMKVKFLFGRLRNPIRRSEATLRKYLGETLGEMLQAQDPDYSLPEFSNCSNYSRCGQTIVFRPTETYHVAHPLNAADAFEHHMFKAYGELADDYARRH